MAYKFTPLTDKLTDDVDTILSKFAKEFLFPDTSREIRIEFIEYILSKYHNEEGLTEC